MLGLRGPAAPDQAPLSVGQSRRWGRFLGCRRTSHRAGPSPLSCPGLSSCPQLLCLSPSEWGRGFSVPATLSSPLLTPGSHPAPWFPHPHPMSPSWALPQAGLGLRQQPQSPSCSWEGSAGWEGPPLSLPTHPCPSHSPLPLPTHPCPSPLTSVPPNPGVPGGKWGLGASLLREWTCPVSDFTWACPCLGLGGLCWLKPKGARWWEG